MILDNYVQALNLLGSPFFVKKLKETEELMSKIGLPPRDVKK
ncbi:hypothetical protein BH09BAC3_BH09BAC3_23330 [soil metagenome]